MNKIILVLAFVCALAGVSLAQTATASSHTVSAVGSSQISLTGSVDSGTLTFGIYSSGCGSCTAPSHGTISQFNASAGTFLYTPTAGYTGSDSLTFTAIKNGSTSSSQATVTITITSAKTTVSDTLTKADGSAYTGTVTFILTQAVASPDAIIPATASVSATLSSGAFTVSLWPSTSLSPQAYYQVWYASTNSLQREFLGLYAIPASSSTITLSPYKVTDTNLVTRYTFVPMSAFQSFINRSYDLAVAVSGTTAGTRGTINFIPGANMSISCVDNSGSGRVDCTFSDPTGGSGGTVGSATSGQIAVYNGTTSVTGKAFGGANRILKTNSSNNDTEWATVTAGTGITITPGTNSITVTNAGVVSINGNSVGAQVIQAGSTTCGSAPAVTSASGTTTVCVPSASASASGVLTASGTEQTVAGQKLFTGFDADDVPIIAKDKASGSGITQAWQDSSGTNYGFFHTQNGTLNSGLYANKFGAGNNMSAPLSGYVIAAQNASSSESESPSGVLFNTALTANDTTSSLRGLLVLYSLDGTGTHSASSASRSAAIDSSFTFNGGGTLTNVSGVRSMLQNTNTGTVTNARVNYSTATASAGTFTNLSHYYVAAPTLTGAGAITNQYGLYLESLTGATNNWAIYSAGTTGSSLGGFLDLRGRTAPTVSASGEFRAYSDTSGNLKASANGGNYGSVPIFLTGSATLDFSSTATASSSDLTITVSGATVGKPVFLGIPASPSTGSHYTAWVSATNTVTVRFSNYSGGSIDPASGTFSVYVVQ